MLSVDVKMSLIVFASVGLSTIFIAFLALDHKNNLQINKSCWWVNDRVEEVYSGHTIVKTYNREDDEILINKSQVMIYRSFLESTVLFWNYDAFSELCDRHFWNYSLWWFWCTKSGSLLGMFKHLFNTLTVFSTYSTSTSSK